jgi:hypothetical protein
VSIGLGDREPDEEHPFGYGKERFFWTLLAAVLIFLAGAVFSIGEGVLRLMHGGEQERFLLAIGTIAFAFVAEGVSFAQEVFLDPRPSRSQVTDCYLESAAGIAATPGSSLPSRSSSAAPPPVDAHDTRSTSPSSLRARIESAPPTTENASAAATA